jgi:hypothetical protein
MKVNLTGVKPWQGAPLAPGTYKATITAANEGVSSHGNPEFELRWVAMDRPNEGRGITDWLTVSRDSLGKLAGLLVAIGHDPDQLTDMEVTPGNLLGGVALITVEERTFEGRTFSRVAAYDRP